MVATEGIALLGPLPPGYELVTMYTAGITERAAHPKQAAALVALLAGADQRGLRQRVGFAG
ncbi:substrate-binding domain-containing protein [Bradyrhizobium sp. LLZ17]|uniref:Substrate-binding domain-containing protein n=1 Tax=Bradyrhizobium sp. LLZ17 TaxID=3239388 RepID=A0AB39XTX6_9BRAD